MVASVASFGSLNLIQGVMARAVAPAAAAPTSEDNARQPAAQLSIPLVAFAPAAMSALLEAQEHMTPGTPVLVRQNTAAEIGQLITELVDAPPPAGPSNDTPFTVRRLETVRVLLAQV